MKGEVVELDAEACRFGYRDSVFKREAQGSLRDPGRALRAPPRRRAQAPLRRAAARFAGTASPSLAEVREAVIALRHRKSMVLDPAGENGKSAGSFFMNPTVSAEELPRVRERAAPTRCPGEAMPEHPAAGGRVEALRGVADRARRLPQGDERGRGRHLDAPRAGAGQQGRRHRGRNRRVRAPRARCRARSGSAWRSWPSRCWWGSPRTRLRGSWAERISSACGRRRRRPHR